MGLLAAGFALWPVFLSARYASVRATGKEQGRKKEVSHEAVVKAVYRDRINELSLELNDDKLRAEVESDLGAVLLSESQLPESEAVFESGGHVASGRRLSSILLALIVPFVGFGIYFSVVDTALEPVRGAEEVLVLTDDDSAALESWTRRLATRVEVAPEDSKSRYLLGHAQLKLGQFSDAAESFALTNQLIPGDLNIQIYWLQARYLAARGVLDEVGVELANKILEQQPGLSVVLEILALDAFRRGDANSSVHLLNRALTGATDIRQQASFATAIKQVRAGMQEMPAGVSVAVKAESTVPPNATVFVVARPVGGGMPFAAVRRPAFLLPLSLRLDDLVSMSPTRKLSDAGEFEIVVRLSKSGQAMPQEGDWQWRSDTMSLSETEVTTVEATLSPNNTPRG